jgi:Bacterial regulatory proteins, luxR family
VAEEMRQLSMIGYSLVTMARIEPARGQRGLCEGRQGTHPPGPETPPVRSASAGLDLLTPQELQIARVVSSGKSNGEVSAALFVSRKTVEVSFPALVWHRVSPSHTGLRGCGSAPCPARLAASQLRLAGAGKSSHLAVR